MLSSSPVAYRAGVSSSATEPISTDFQRRNGQRQLDTDHSVPDGLSQSRRLPGFPLSGSGAVIWAAGGAGLPHVQRDQLICSAEQDRELLWIDVQDEHHRDLSRASSMRRQAYAAAGWHPSGTRGTIARIRQFLAERPGGDA